MGLVGKRCLGKSQQKGLVSLIMDLFIYYNTLFYINNWNKMLLSLICLSQLKVGSLASKIKAGPTLLPEQKRTLNLDWKHAKSLKNWFFDTLLHKVEMKYIKEKLWKLNGPKIRNKLLGLCTKYECICKYWSNPLKSWDTDLDVWLLEIFSVWPSDCMIKGPFACFFSLLTSSLLCFLGDFSPLERRSQSSEEVSSVIKKYNSRVYIWK